MQFKFLPKKPNYKKLLMTTYKSSQEKKSKNYSNNILKTKKAFIVLITQLKKPKLSIQIAMSEKYRNGF